MSKKQDMLAEIDTLNREVKGIFDQADQDSADGKSGDLDAQTWQKVKDNNKRIEELEGHVATLIEQETARKGAAERGRLPTPRSGQEPSKTMEVHAKTLGDLVVRHDEFQAWQKKVSPAPGHVQRAAFGVSPTVPIAGGMKTLITGVSATSGGALAVAQSLGVLDTGTWRRPLTIRDLISIGATDTDTIEYVRQTSVTNAAAPVAEATATSGVSGLKPESAMAFQVITESVKTVAHWIAATRRTLSDAKQLRTYIDTFLRYGLDEALETQIVQGDGIGDNFLGILNQPGVTAQAWDTNLLTTTRRARTKVRTVGRAQATAYVMHPTDWESMDLLQDAENRYYFGGPSVLGTPRLWGLPVVESEAYPVGTAEVADWRLAMLWDREIAQILVSDSHADFFIRNIIAILAELRAAFTVIRPAAFVEIDLTA